MGGCEDPQVRLIPKLSVLLRSLLSGFIRLQDEMCSPKIARVKGPIWFSHHPNNHPNIPMLTGVLHFGVFLPSVARQFRLEVQHNEPIQLTSFLHGIALSTTTAPGINTVTTSARRMTRRGVPIFRFSLLLRAMYILGLHKKLKLRELED